MRACVRGRGGVSVIGGRVVGDAALFFIWVNTCGWPGRVRRSIGGGAHPFLPLPSFLPIHGLIGQNRIEALEEVERAFVHLDVNHAAHPEHVVKD